MSLARITLARHRIVHAPDGREWHIWVQLYRLPHRGDPRATSEEGIGDQALAEVLLNRWPLMLLVPLAKVVDALIGPFIQATVGHRPWIVATTEHPRTRMVWRATGRYPVAEAVDELSAALERGEMMPVLISARWFAYDEGNVVLPRKLTQP